MTTPGDGAPVNHTHYFSCLGPSCFSQATRLASLGGEYLKGGTEKAYRAEHEFRVNEGSRLPAYFIPVFIRSPCGAPVDTVTKPWTPRLPLQVPGGKSSKP